MMCAQYPTLEQRCYSVHPSHGNMGWLVGPKHDGALMLKAQFFERAISG